MVWFNNLCDSWPPTTYCQVKSNLLSHGGEINLQPGIKKHTTNNTTHKMINSNGDSITTQMDKDENMK